MVGAKIGKKIDWAEPSRDCSHAGPSRAGSGPENFGPWRPLSPDYANTRISHFLVKFGNASDYKRLVKNNNFPC